MYMLCLTEPSGWFNPMAGWIGWIAGAVSIMVFGYLWYRMRKKKNVKTPSKMWRVPVDGFADVFVPKTYSVVRLDVKIEVEYSKEMAEELAHKLNRARKDVWAACEEIYAYVCTPEPGWCVGKVSVVRDYWVMPEGHDHVVWGAPHGRIKLLLQDDMFYWFVRECHNVFRYRMHGMKWIYKVKDGQDLGNRAKVEAWIDRVYLHGK